MGSSGEPWGQRCGTSPGSDTVPWFPWVPLPGSDTGPSDVLAFVVWVSAGPPPAPGGGADACCGKLYLFPKMSHNFVSLDNITNMLWHL